MLDIASYAKYENRIDSFLSEYTANPLPIILFGLGGSIDVYLDLLDKYDLNPEFIIDNNPCLSGTMYRNIKICSIVAINDVNTAYIIIAAPSHAAAIKKQILDISNKYNIIEFDPSLEIIQNTNHRNRLEFYTENADELNNLHNSLSDDRSKSTLENIIKGALTGDNSFYNSIATNNQYFPDIIIQSLTDNEVFVDVGAYTGDSSIEFIKTVNGKYSKIIGFEPKKENIEQAYSLINDERAIFHPYGVGEKNETLYLYGDEGLDDFAYISDKQNESATKIDIVTIDEFIHEKYTYMKMDIEGMEEPALLGARKTIKEYHPKLAISVYHKLDDLITIPKTILEIDPSYKLYLRHYWGYCGTDTILFAI